jgi:hypothetical protein
MELERMWKETVVPSSEAQYRDLLGLEKTTKTNQRKENRSLGRGYDITTPRI